MSMTLVKAGVVFFGRKRPGFDEVWGSAMADRVRDTVARQDWQVFICATKAVDDASVRRAIDECRSAGCDTLVVLQTTMSDGRLAPILAQAWAAPVVLWATPEKPEGDLVSSCSLVGTHLFASLFARLELPFEVISGAPEDPRLIGSLNESVLATAAAGRLRGAKAGLVGYHAPGFINMHASPYDLHHRLGAELYHFGQQELLALVDSVPADELEADAEATAALGMPLVDLEADDLVMQSRFYLAMKRLITDENLDSLAVRCWPELPNLTGQWPYLAMVRLADEGFAVTMEGDVDGSVGMLLLRLLGLETGFLTDWLEHDDTHITTWHGGGTPACLARPKGSPGGRTIARHFNSGKPAVVDGWIAPERPVTIMRIWGDSRGYHMVVREAETVEPTRHLKGTNGRIRLDENAHDLFDNVCHAGMPHHLTVFPGHHGAKLRLLARLLRMDIV